jgi:prepilin-type N-terminal cleavage/methylation domain-containing protein
MRTPHLPRSAGNRGFTLIELLVVIAIILVIAGLTTVAVIPLISKSKMQRTIGSIRMAESGVELFKDTYPERAYGAAIRRGYPRADELGLSPVPSRSDAEFLRIVCSPTTLELTGTFANTRVTEAVFEFSVIKEYLNSTQVEWRGDLYEAETIFVDGWDQGLYYRFPGLNHSLETNFVTQRGNNHFTAGRPDIWSQGEDEDNFYITGREGEWPGEMNDPPNSGTALNDDIANWFPLDDY